VKAVVNLKLHNQMDPKCKFQRKKKLKEKNPESKSLGISLDSHSYLKTKQIINQMKVTPHRFKAQTKERYNHRETTSF